MEARITISGFGFAAGRSGFGVNVASGAYIEIRPAKGAPACKLGLATGPELGSENGSLVFGHLQTHWFPVSNDLYPHFLSPDYMVGRAGDVEVKGALIAGGTVDIKVDVIDGAGNVETILSKAQIKASGLQASSTQVRGTIKRMSPATACTLEVD